MQNSGEVSHQKPSLGVLNLSHGESKFKLTRLAPSKEIDFFVRHYWIVSWDLTGEEPYWQEVIPNPCVNLAFEKNRTGIFGIKQGKSAHLLQDKGLVFRDFKNFIGKSPLEYRRGISREA